MLTNQWGIFEPFSAASEWGIFDSFSWGWWAEDALEVGFCSREEAESARLTRYPGCDETFVHEIENRED